MKSTLSDRHFHDEKAAYAFVEARVWPNGPVCPHCGGVDRISAMMTFVKVIEAGSLLAAARELKLSRAPSRPSLPQSANSWTSTRPRNAPTISKTPAMRLPKSRRL